MLYGATWRGKEPEGGTQTTTITSATPFFHIVPSCHDLFCLLLLHPFESLLILPASFPTSPFRTKLSSSSSSLSIFRIRKARCTLKERFSVPQIQKNPGSIRLKKKHKQYIMATLKDMHGATFRERNIKAEKDKLLSRNKDTILFLTFCLPFFYYLHLFLKNTVLFLLNVSREIGIEKYVKRKWTHETDHL